MGSKNTTSTHICAFGSLHTNDFTHRKNVIPHGSCCAQKCLHTKSSGGAIIFKINANKICSCTAACTHKCFYKQRFTHHFFCTDRLFCAHVFVLTSACAHSDTEAILRTPGFFTRKSFTPDTRMWVKTREASPRRQWRQTQCFDPHKMLHRGAAPRTEAFKQKLSHKIALTRRELLHTEAFRQIICYTFTLSFSAPMLQKIVILHFIFGRWACVDRAARVNPEHLANPSCVSCSAFPMRRSTVLTPKQEEV